MMTRQELASRLDTTVAAPGATAADVHKAAADAMRLGVASLFAPPVWTARLTTMMQGSGVAVGSLVAFPYGGSKPTIKAIEATSTIKDGAARVEIVPNLALLLGLDVDGARAELIEIMRAARAVRRDVNIATLVDVGILMGRENSEDRGNRVLESACRSAREGGCDGIVIAGIAGIAGDATEATLALVKGYAQSLTVKAMADTAVAARALLAAGAERVGVAVPQAVLDSIEA
jgi:deoxyribose-phosphate aldolase